MINILICESGLGYGGSASYLYSFLKYLDKATFQPIILFYHKGQGPFISKILKMCDQVEYLSNNKDITIPKYSACRYFKYIQMTFELIMSNFYPIIRMIAIIKKRKIDLILLNQDVVFHIPAILAAAIVRVPCIVRKGGVGVYKGNRMWKMLSMFPDVFIASSHAEYNFHIESGFPYKKMMVIFEGVDVDAFKPGSGVKNIHNEFNIAPETTLIGLISRIDHGKGHEDVIEASSLVLKEYPHAVFLIVGDEDESLKKDLFDQVKSLGLQDKVIFTGWRKDTSEILKEIDIFVHCPNTWREGMGIATLEALASGKPVVITDNWGLADTTKDGYNGFVVPIGDRKMISESILTLLKDKELRAKMGANSRARAHELFDISKNIKSIERIMLETISSGKI